MSKRRPIQFAIAMTALSPILYTSCVDNDYDLSKDIDLTMTIGGNNMAMPACSTDTISLRKIFDLSDDEQNTLKTNRGEIDGLAWGDYYLKENNSDDPRTSTLTVERTTLDLGTSTEEKQTLTFANPALAGLTEDLQTLINLTTEFNLHNERVPGQLRRLNWVALNAPVTVRLYFNSADGIRRLSMKSGLKIELGDFIELAPQQGAFYKAEGNVITITQDTPIDENGKNIVVNLQKIDLEHTHMTDRFTPSTDSKNEDLYGTIDLPMDIKVNGDMALAVADYPSGKLTAKAEFRAKIEIAQAEVLSANGVIAPNFHVDFDPIDFVDIPEFLNDEETNIDLFDPQIFVTVSNTAPVGINISADMLGLDEDGNVIIVNGKEAKIHLGNDDYTAQNALFMDKESTTTFALSIKPHSYKGDTVCIQVPELNRLIGKIPAQIGVENINPTVPQVPYTVTLNRTHNIDTHYEIVTPLAFGENLNFVYKDTLDGWGEDLEDMKLKKVEIEIETANTIPMAMELTATPLYKDDIERNNVGVEVQGRIEAGTGDLNNPKEGAIKVVLSCPDGNLEGLDGLKLYIKGESNPSIAGVALNERQTLRIKKAVVRIKEGITVDLN